MKKTIKILSLLLGLISYSQTTTYLGAAAGEGGTYNSNFGYLSGSVNEGSFSTFLGANSGEKHFRGLQHFFRESFRILQYYRWWEYFYWRGCRA